MMRAHTRQWPAYPTARARPNSARWPGTADVLRLTEEPRRLMATVAVGRLPPLRPL